MTATRQDHQATRPYGSTSTRSDEPRGRGGDPGTSAIDWSAETAAIGDSTTPVRKAAIVLVSLDQTVASQLLSHLDRPAVEAVTWEIAQLERVDPEEREAVLEEFYRLGLRRLCFVFDDLVKMSDADIRIACHDEDLETWALALAGAAAAIRAKVQSALDLGLASRLNRALEQLGPFRLSDSESAQLEITERLRRLYDNGRIALPETDGSEEALV